MRLILPNTFVENSKIDYPLFFLAGPVRGGGNWQENCCLAIARRNPSFFAAVPCRWQKGDNLFCYRENGTDNGFTRQTDWEHYYLNLASERSVERKGCIIFWLPAEDQEHPRDDGHPYARDTYGELGRWGRNAALTGARLIVGAEQLFWGLSVIKENLKLDFKLKTEFPVCDTLEETAAQAVEWVKL